MADAILRGELYYPGWDLKKPAARMLTRDLEAYIARLEQAIVIEASNVCEFFYVVTDQKMWKIQDDFPNLAPPFPLFWIEMRRPSKIVTAEKEIWRSDQHLPFRAGYLFEVFPANRAWKMLTAGTEFEPFPPDPELMERLKRESRWRYTALEAARRHAESSDDEAWVYKIGLFMERDAGHVEGPFALSFLFVDRDGKGLSRTEPFPAFCEIPVIEDYIRRTMNFHMFPALLTICFLHCKNVQRTTIAPPNRICRKYQRRYGVEPLKYETLLIAPMREVLRREGGMGTGANLQRAMHICRGHFRNYDDKPLFGKYKGIVWVPMHVRGNLDFGTVIKDYKMKGPFATPANGGNGSGPEPT